MGNCLFSLGSWLIDTLGFGVKRSKVPTDDEDDDHIDRDEIVITKIEEMEAYCKPLIFLRFCGQTSSATDTDTNAEKGPQNTGSYLQMLDALIRTLPKDELKEGFCQTKAFQGLLWKIADRRHRDEESEQRCYRRLLRDSKRFEKVFLERAAKKAENQEEPYSEELHEQHAEYWGTRQQLLAGKVICDWLSEDDQPSMDPIYGVLLNPTAGRVGPGDSGFVHSLLYDNSGEWAHHSAVHDAFGYLFTFHQLGPGYNYMYRSFFDADNPLAGQISGIDFWKKYVAEVETKLKVIENFRSV
ncbi:uncharacterized protein [Clytia hemisphaerica]|uniref:Uncharacterized protein n=1 Tax=Clytia hemisphaerica TaxID=252671 RepID=A0A7M5UQZ9_9CNID|eukprot:TCONS_00013001-protein